MFIATLFTIAKPWIQPKCPLTDDWIKNMWQVYIYTKGPFLNQFRIPRILYIISSVQSLIRVQLFATPWTAAHQASLSISKSRSLLKLMSLESVMPSNCLILCHPLLPPSIFSSIRVFSNESILHIRWPKYCSFSFSICPSNEYSGLISFRKIAYNQLPLNIGWMNE